MSEIVFLNTGFECLLRCLLGMKAEMFVEYALRLLRAGDGDGSVEGGAARTARARCRVAHGVALSICMSCWGNDLNYNDTVAVVRVVVVVDVDVAARLV